MQPVERLKSMLKKLAIKRDQVNGFDKYTILDEYAALFTVGFNPKTKQYGFGRSPRGKRILALNGIFDTNIPDYSAIFQVVQTQYYQELIAYAFYLIIDQNEIYASDTETEETYEITSENKTVFAVIYDKKTGKYTLKRNKDLFVLYSALNVPFNIEPYDLKELHKRAKNEYNWQVVRDTVDQLYDFVPDYYANIR